MTLPKIEGEAVPPPIVEVAQAGFHRSLVTDATSRGLAKPLTLQKYMWPVVARGRNAVCVSKHNSGKTLGYLLPILSCVIESQEQVFKTKADEYGPIALILVSSPKTAKHIGKVCAALLASTANVECVVLHSELSECTVYSQLLNGCSILIATPQSFLKALLVPSSHRYTFTNLRRVTHLVIDEAEILLSQCQESISNILSEIGQALSERKRKSNAAATSSTGNSVQFVITASEMSEKVEEFYQSLEERYQPILIKGNEK